MRIRLPGCPNTFRIGEDIVLPLPAHNVLAPAPNAPPEWQPADTTSRQSTFVDLTKHVNGHLSAVQLYFAAKQKESNPPANLTTPNQHCNIR